MSDEYHTMRSLLGKAGYITLEIPKNIDLPYLEIAKAVVNFQLDVLIKFANTKTYAETEYDSWGIEP